MKITNKQIKQIIKEELDKILENEEEIEYMDKRTTKTGVRLKLGFNKVRKEYVVHYRFPYGGEGTFEFSTYDKALKSFNSDKWKIKKQTGSDHT